MTTADHIEDITTALGFDITQWFTTSWLALTSLNLAFRRYCLGVSAMLTTMAFDRRGSGSAPDVRTGVTL